MTTRPVIADPRGVPGIVVDSTATVPAGSWLVRWDTVADARPQFARAKRHESDTTSVSLSASGRTVLFDGYLVDGAEPGDRPDASQAARVAATYERWPDAVFDRLRGGFTLAVWDEQQRELLAGRDAMGLHPCFYWWNGRLLLLAASVDSILAQPEVDHTFNRVLIAEYLQNARCPQQATETFFEGIHRLAPSHYLRLDRRGISVTRYWDPVPPGFAWMDDRDGAGFQAALERAVARCLAAGADSLALSGGFDSVSIAILAAAQLEGRRPLHAVSLRFPEGVCDEGETQTAVARALRMPQLMRSVAESVGEPDVVRAALAFSPSSPSPVLSPWQALYTGLLRSAADLNLTRLLMGTGGDDMLNVDLSYGADRLAALDLRGLWRFYGAWRRTSPFSALRVAQVLLWDEALRPEARRLGKALLTSVAPRGLEWLRVRRRRQRSTLWGEPPNPTLAAAIARRRDEPLAVPLAPGERRYAQTLRRLTQAPLLLLECDQSYAWARSQGLTLLYPYLDRDVVEHSLRMHPDSLLAGGRAKAPLRRLAAERLPTVPLPTRKVDFTAMMHDVLRPGGRSVWQDLGSPDMLAQLGVTDEHYVSRVMTDYFEGRSMNWLQVWLVLSTETWLRTHVRASSS
jgi:asparagine synthase (glutamine-hydrolysing)